MTEWFRNSAWTPEIEAEFEARLARSRGQKAQYLRIQGSMLKDSHPEIAIGLLQRCIHLGDETQIAAAMMDSAQAYYRMGNLDQALACLEAAIAQEARQPMFRTSAPFDYAMLVALHGRSERFDSALAVLDLAGAGLLPVMDYQAEGARAVILSAKGKDGEARAAAARALAAQGKPGWIPGHPDVGMMPHGNDPLSALVRQILDRPRG